MARTSGNVIRGMPPLGRKPGQPGGQVFNQPSAPIVTSKPMPNSAKPARAPSLDNAERPSGTGFGQRPDPDVGSHNKSGASGWTGLS